jgi:hypothetical protein
MDYPLNDPQLQALEARLRAMTPPALPAEQQQLLYGCAFAAGRRVALRALRPWQGAAVVLTVLLIGATVPLARERSSLAPLSAEQPAQNRAPEPEGAEDEMRPLAARRAIAVSLDAWQAKASPRASFDDELAQFAQIDPRLRSLTVAALTRQLLDQ